MQVEIKMDDSYTEPKIILLTATMTKEVNMILNKLSENPPQVISGCRNGKIEVIEQEDLIRVYANSGKVFAVTDKGEYTIRLRLYEIEERLDPDQFVRIFQNLFLKFFAVIRMQLKLHYIVKSKMHNSK